MQGPRGFRRVAIVTFVGINAGPVLGHAPKLDTARIEEITGLKGMPIEQECVFKVTSPRSDTRCGCDIGKEMGVNTWAAFAGTDEKAVVDGDFAMLEGELQGVLKALRRADINVVAIHHHMTGETPRILFLHYWGRGHAAALARGLKAALDTQKEIP